MKDEIKEKLERVWNFHKAHNNGIMAVTEAKKLVEEIIEETSKAKDELIEKLSQDVLDAFREGKKQSLDILKDFLWNDPKANYGRLSSFELLQVTLEKIEEIKQKLEGGK